MEGVIYAQRQNLDILRDMHSVPETMQVCGGDAKSPFGWQMIADIFHMPVRALANPESSALGAAILAGIAAGLYPDAASACRKMVAFNVEQQPNSENADLYEPYYRLYINPALKDSFSALSTLGS